MQTDATAVGDVDGAVVKRIREFRQAAVAADGGSADFRGAPGCAGMCSTFVGLCVASKLDRKALLEWSAANGVDMGKGLDSLAAAEPGSAAIWSPVFGGQMGTRFKVALRSTFHPSARDLNGNRAVKLKQIGALRVSVPAAFSWRSIWGGLCGKQGLG